VGNLRTVINDVPFSEGPKVTDDYWYYVGVTMDRDGDAIFYVDGSPVGSPEDISVHNVAQTVEGATIGSFPYTGGFFNGIIDDVRVWDRVLTPQEIQDNYNSFGEDCTDSIDNDIDGDTDCEDSDCWADSNCIFVLEAETMPIQTTGAPIAGGYNIWSNGYIGEIINVNAGTYSFVIRARSRPDTMCGGEHADMELRETSTLLQPFDVDYTSYTDFTTSEFLDEGDNEIRIAFTNDYYGACDRNLHVDKVTIQRTA